MAKHSPGYLIALLTAHATPEPINMALAQDLLEQGMIEVCGREYSPTYTTTDRGYKFVEMLCEVPLPESRWVDPREKEGKE